MVNPPNDLSLAQTAASFATDTSGFGGILSVADDTIQKALDTLDDKALDKTGDTMSGALNMGAQNITNVGTVDGVDVAALKTDVDAFPDELQSLTAAEVTQVQAINLVTITNAQWAYLGDLDQALHASQSPAWAGLTINGNIAVTGTVDGVDVAALAASVAGLPANLNLLTTAEVTQLTNINLVTITNAQWTYLGELDQALKTTDSPTFANLTVTTNITVSGTVDGRDVAADGANLDTLFSTIGLGGMTTAEATQLKNIDLVTITNAQWVYLGDLDQALTASSSPTFANLTVTTNITVGGTVDGRDVAADGANLDTLIASGLAGLTAAEVAQLATINLVTISNTQWGYLGALDQGLTTSSAVQHTSLHVTGNITLTTGTVDGRDVSADGAKVDTWWTIGLQALTIAEVDQLENIDLVTITNAQWAHLGDMDQDVATDSDVTFDDLTITGSFTVTGNITMAEDAWIGIGAGVERIVFDGTGGLVYVADSKFAVGTSAVAGIAHFYQDTNDIGGNAGITIEQDGIGDAVVQFLITGAERWIMGAQNDNNDRFCIAESSALGTNNIIVIDPATHFTQFQGSNETQWRDGNTKLWSGAVGYLDFGTVTAFRFNTAALLGIGPTSFANPNGATHMVTIEDSGAGAVMLRLRPINGGAAGVDDLCVMSHYISGRQENILWSNSQYAFGVKTSGGGDTYTQTNLLTDPLLLVKDTGEVGIGQAPTTTLNVLGASSDTIADYNAILIVESNTTNALHLGCMTSSPFTSYIQSGADNDPDTFQYPLSLQPAGGGVAIGGTTVPRGGHGGGLLSVHGANATGNGGPWAQFTTAADDFPLLQIMNWSHDVMGLLFDCYATPGGVFKSSDSGSCYRIYKNGDSLQFGVDAGVAPGSNVTFDLAFRIEADAEMTFSPGAALKSYHRNANAWVYSPAASILELSALSYVRVGAGSTSRSLSAHGDLLVSGKLEVDGLAYFDSDVGIGGAPTVPLHVQISNTTTTGAVLIQQASTGDAALQFTAGANWIIGIDNSDDDQLKICYSNLVGTNPWMTFSRSTGRVGIQNASPTSVLDVAGDVEIGSANAYYFGDPATNGTWRLIRSGSDLLVQLRESGSYVTKGTFTP